MEDVHESLLFPSPEEVGDKFQSELYEEKIREANEIPTEQINRILAGEEIDNLLDMDDLREVLLRRAHANKSHIFVLPYIIVLMIVAFFGWKLYQSIKDKEKKKEEKKKLKQKKKK